MNLFERKNAELLTELDRYVIEHPQIKNAIPDGALVAMEVEDDQGFSEWSRQTARTHAEPGQEIVFMLRQMQSWVKKLAIAT